MSPFAPGFRRCVRERLAIGAREYGDSWTTRPVAELLAEIMEECADIGGWAALAIQAVDSVTELDAEDHEFVADALQAAARFGACAYARVGNARLRLVKSDGGDDRRVR